MIGEILIAVESHGFVLLILLPDHEIGHFLPHHVIVPLGVLSLVANLVEIEFQKLVFPLQAPLSLQNVLLLEEKLFVLLLVLLLHGNGHFELFGEETLQEDHVVVLVRLVFV